MTTAQIQERILQDIESISNAITSNEKSESDIISNSPNKDSEKDNRSARESSNIRNGSISLRGNSEVGYSRRLRNRRNRGSQLKQY